MAGQHQLLLKPEHRATAGPKSESGLDLSGITSRCGRLVHVPLRGLRSCNERCSVRLSLVNPPLNTLRLCEVAARQRFTVRLEQPGPHLIMEGEHFLEFVVEKYGLRQGVLDPVFATAEPTHARILVICEREFHPPAQLLGKTRPSRNLLFS